MRGVVSPAMTAGLERLGLRRRWTRGRLLRRARSTVRRCSAGVAPSPAPPRTADRWPRGRSSTRHGCSSAAPRSTSASSWPTPAATWTRAPRAEIASPAPLYCVASTSRPRAGDLHGHGDRGGAVGVLLATTRMPWIGGPPVTIAGRRYVDGALAAAIPLAAALEAGATHVLVLQTRPTACRARRARAWPTVHRAPPAPAQPRSGRPVARPRARVRARSWPTSRRARASPAADGRRTSWACARPRAPPSSASSSAARRCSSAAAAAAEQLVVDALGAVPRRWRPPRERPAVRARAAAGRRRSGSASPRSGARRTSRSATAPTSARTAASRPCAPAATRCWTRPTRPACATSTPRAPTAWPRTSWGVAGPHGRPPTMTVGSKWGYTYTGDWRLDAEDHEVKDLSRGHAAAPADRDAGALGGRLALYQVHSATRRERRPGRRRRARRARGAARRAASRSG